MHIASHPAVTDLVRNLDLTLEAAIGKHLHVGIVELPPAAVIADELARFATTDHQKFIAEAVGKLVAPQNLGKRNESNYETVSQLLRLVAETQNDPLTWSQESRVRHDLGRFAEFRSTIVPRCCTECDQRRKDPTGDFRCWWSDLVHGWEVFEHSDGKAFAEHYVCTLSGFTEIVGTIRLGSNPVANIFAGQFYVVEQDAEAPPERKILQPILSCEERDRAVEIVKIFAGVISHQYTLINTQKIAERIDVTNNISSSLRESLSPFWELISEFVTFDGGSIWLIDNLDRWQINPKSTPSFHHFEHDHCPLKKKEFYPSFFTDSSKRHTFTVCENIGSIPKKHMTPSLEAYMKQTKMASFAWTPLYWQQGDRQVFGVIELSSLKERAFTEADGEYLEPIAVEMTAAIRTNMIVVALRKILMASDYQSVVASVVRYMPSVVNGIGCSLFLRMKPGEGSAYLVDSEGEGIKRRKLAGIPDVTRRIFHEGEIAQYGEGEGLTGWVLESGHALNLEIKGHGKERTRDRAVERVNKYLQSLNEQLGTSAGKIPMIREWKGKDLGEMDRRHYEQKAWLGVPIISRREHDKVWGVLRVSERIEGNFSQVDVNLLSECAHLIADKLEREVESERYELLLTETIKTLSNAIDAKHEYTHDHSSEVVKWSELIFDNLDEEARVGKSRQLLTMAAMLHDIGKLRIPDALLNTNKPYRDDWQFAALRKHPEYGAEILAPLNVEGMDDVIRAVAQHHENMAGTGYPNKLKGSDVHLYAKIIAVADSFNAITARTYQEGKRRTREEAFRLIMTNEYRGRQPMYDDKVLAAFEKAYKSEFDGGD